MKVLWLTDLHVDKLEDKKYRQLLKLIVTSKPDAIWLTGDIGDPPHHIQFLEALLKNYKKSLYFVLGNHDYYSHKIADMRLKMHELTQSYPQAVYLSKASGIYVDKHLIVGMDCWANTGKDTIQKTTWDSDMIMDLDSANESNLARQLNALAEFDAKKLLARCQRQIHEKTSKVSILTHVPPTDALQGQYRVKPLQKNRSIFYSPALSEVLHQLALDFPTVQFNVYSGHIHQTQKYQISENVFGHVARAYQPSKPLNWINI